MYPENTAGISRPSSPPIRGKLESNINSVRRCLNFAREIRNSIEGIRPEAVSAEQKEPPATLHNQSDLLSSYLSELEGLLDQIQNQL